MIQGLILTHGDLGRSLLETVVSLAGPQPGLAAVSNAGCGLPDIVERARAAARELPPGPILIFVDLMGGSCAQAGRLLSEASPDWRVITGVNVPMLVNFVQNREHLGLDELVEMVVSRAREGVKQIPEKRG